MQPALRDDTFQALFAASLSRHVEAAALTRSQTSTRVSLDQVLGVRYEVSVAQIIIRSASDAAEPVMPGEAKKLEADAIDKIDGYSPEAKPL